MNIQPDTLHEKTFQLEDLDILFCDAAVELPDYLQTFYVTQYIARYGYRQITDRIIRAAGIDESSSSLVTIEARNDELFREEPDTYFDGWELAYRLLYC